MISSASLKHRTLAKASRVRYRRWRNAVRLTNGVAELVVVPEIGGRIVRYGYVGGPNMLWCPPASRDLKQRWNGWNNWGGDKSWVWPQEGWPRTAGHAWLPPLDFDQAAYELHFHSPLQLELRSPPLLHYQWRQLVRTITLAPEGTGTLIQTRLTSAPAATATTTGVVSAGWEQPSQAAVWQVTQIPIPRLLLLRNVTDSSWIQGRPTALNRGLLVTPSWSAERVASAGGAVVWKLMPRGVGRIDLFATDANGTLHVHNGVAFEQHLHSSSTLGGGESAGSEQSRIYLDDRSSDPADRYVEIEWVGSLVPLGTHAAESVITVGWSLRRLVEDGTPLMDVHSLLQD